MNVCVCAQERTENINGSGCRQRRKRNICYSDVLYFFDADSFELVTISQKFHPVFDIMRTSTYLHVMLRMH